MHLICSDLSGMYALIISAESIGQTTLEPLDTFVMDGREEYHLLPHTGPPES